MLLNDVQKKLIESYAYPTLDSFWEKRVKEVWIMGSFEGVLSDSEI